MRILLCFVSCCVVLLLVGFKTCVGFVGVLLDTLLGKLLCTVA
jgi:hypothetical protein